MNSDKPAGREERLLLDPNARVTCPNCRHEFSLADGFAKQSLERLEASSHGALAEIHAQARAAEERRARERAVEAERLQHEQLQDLQAALRQQKKQHAEAIEQMRLLEQQAGASREAALKEQLGERSRQIERYQATELQLRKDRADLEAKQQQLELAVQRRIDEERRRIVEQARAAEAESHRLHEADMKKKLDDLRGQVELLKRKAEQGSQQFQGEVLELLLEEQLAGAFPLDEIVEVKKGARGGDALQRVRMRSGQQAGLILWEAKRAQNWSAGWPRKLKEDMRAIGADLGVIVATSLPKEFADGQHFGPHEDVWVTTPGLALQVAGLLRYAIEGAHKQRVVSANRDEQAGALYDYMTSPQFAQKWRAVHDAFKAMQKELDSEKTSTMQRWARRQKGIEQAVLTLVGVAGEIQGLAQQALPQLELADEARQHTIGET